MKRQIEVVGAILIDNQENILCTQRKNSGVLALKWEFPGGKVETGETPQEALIREIKEELELDIFSLSHFLTVNYEYTTFTILFHTFTCKCLNTNYVLNDHENAKWVNRKDLLTLDWADADLPIVAKLMEGGSNELFRSFSKQNV